MLYRHPEIRPWQPYTERHILPVSLLLYSFRYDTGIPPGPPCYIRNTRIKRHPANELHTPSTDSRPDASGELPIGIAPLRSKPMPAQYAKQTLAILGTICMRKNTDVHIRQEAKARTSKLTEPSSVSTGSSPPERFASATSA